MAMPKPIQANSPDLVELGEGSAVRFEQDGGTTLYLDKRDTSKTDFPEWHTSHCLPPSEAVALSILLNRRLP